MLSCLYIDELCRMNKGSILWSSYIYSSAYLLILLLAQLFVRQRPVELYIYSSALILLQVGFIFLLKNKTSVSKIWLLLVVFNTILVYVYFSGSSNSPGFIWFTIIPLLARLFFTRAASNIIFLCTFCTILCFTIFDVGAQIEGFQQTKSQILLSYIGYLFLIYFYVGNTKKLLKIKAKRLLDKSLALRQNEQELLQQAELIMYQNKVLQDTNEKFTSGKRRLEKYMETLAEIARMSELHDGNFNFSILKISEVLRETLNADRVTLWTFNSSENKLLRIYETWTNQTRQLQKPKVLLARTDQHWVMEQLIGGVTLHLNKGINAQEYDEWCAINGSEYHFNQVLCCPYYIDGDFSGIVVCEYLDTSFSIGMEEKMLIRSISEHISIAYKAQEKLLSKMQLEKKQREIKELNESLEFKVAERTKTIQEKNSKLEQFAFFNAHELRGPICRLQGLQNLIEITENPKDLMIIKNAMITSINELDDLTQRSSKLLYDD